MLSKEIKKSIKDNFAGRKLPYSVALVLINYIRIAKNDYAMQFFIERMAKLHAKI
jgi:hypothetical protein